MKSTAFTALFFAFYASTECDAVWTAAIHGRSTASQKKGSTISNVVKLLEQMLQQSNADGDADRNLFNKFACYCSTKQEAKQNEIEQLETEVSLLESKIDELKAETGKLSSESATLDRYMSRNKQARADADALRQKESQGFQALKEDLTSSIAQMDQAIDTLGQVGADQSISESADHTKFMAGFKGASMLKLKAEVRKALTAASGVLTLTQRSKVQSFLQAPFTGTYSPKSAEVIGILKSMRDTFKQNLDHAWSSEKMQKEVHEEFMTTKMNAFDEMQELFQEKQAAVGNNDGELAAKKGQFDEAQNQKVLNQEFLSQLIPLCQEKSSEYQERKALRDNENAAIAEAISILDSDAAFSTFGEVKATTSGATGPALLVQLSSKRHRVRAVSVGAAAAAKRLLRKVGTSQKVLGLIRIAVLLEKGNPFTVVLSEIEKLLQASDKESEADQENLRFCQEERVTNRKALAEKKSESTSLASALNTVVAEIDAPETGLKYQIKTTEKSLQDNFDEQKTSTEIRTKENLLYQKSIANLVKAEELLVAARGVLSKYYEKVSVEHAGGAMFFQQAKPLKLPGETDAVPETWEAEGGYKGQGHSGNKAVDMLEFILEETKKEQTLAHQDEEKAQHQFEDSMAQLKDNASALQESLSSLKKTVADKEQERAHTARDLKTTKADKAAVEAYLEEIKPGCDFITKNLDERNNRREAEKKSLSGSHRAAQRNTSIQGCSCSRALAFAVKHRLRT